jgi:putative addiction module component (TIGR02574 family)
MSTIDHATILSLSVEERLQLISELWDSLSANEPQALEPTQAQISEARRRLARYKADPSTAIPWEEFEEELKARFDWDGT